MPWQLQISLLGATCLLFTVSEVGALSVHGADLGQLCSSESCKIDPLIACRDGFCVCVSGYVQNRTVEYTKEECVPPIVPTKNYGESCTWGQCQGELVCRSGRCACPFYRPAYNAQNKACEKSGRGEPCLSCSRREPAGPCHQGGPDSEGLRWTTMYDDGCNAPQFLHSFVCVLNICKCKPEYVNYNVASKVCEKLYQGSDCGDDRECHNVSDGEEGLDIFKVIICQNGKCTCTGGYPMWDAGIRECRKYLHGEQCANIGDCKNIDSHRLGLECENGHCACEPGSILDSFTNTCKTPRGASCNQNEECAHSQGLKCVNRTCACPRPTQQFNVTTSTCMAVKLDGGKKCFNNGVWNHSLCESGVCVGEDTNQVELVGRCACANETEYRTFYYRNDTDGSFRCYPDYSSGRVCTGGGHARCYPVGVEYDLHGNGLQCKGVCACDKANHVYFLGRCVEAYRTYNETCDPYGVTQSTCNLDPAIALVCRKDGTGNGQCECRKTGMNTTDGKMIFVDLSWNATAQKCELEMKKEGMMCKANDECQSGECGPSGSAAKCAPMPGAGIQIQSGKILIIVITVIFTMLK